MILTGSLFWKANGGTQPYLNTAWLNVLTALARYSNPVATYLPRDNMQRNGW